MDFRKPPVLFNEKGKIRTVGFELEFSNLGIEESVKIIQELYGGKIEKINRFYHKVLDTKLGDFTVEFDLKLLTEKSYKKLFNRFKINIDDVKIGNTSLEEGIETVLESIVGKIFPYEIASPPIIITQLDELEKLRESLFRHHAHGTKSFLTNAYGTHINIEVPDDNPQTVMLYLRSFLLLYPWLLEEGDTDFARKVSPFIDPFPEDYVRLVLNKNYNPDLSTIIVDYHQFNPDRNRPLDLYPLLAYLKGDILSKYPNLGKVNPRNTFHYRLPNSSISEPGWSLAQEWNNWVYIEELANDPAKVELMSEEYLNLKEITYIGFDFRWTRRIQQWLN
jgi:hypothetical protein